MSMTRVMPGAGLASVIGPGTLSGWGLEALAGQQAQDATGVTYHDSQDYTSSSSRHGTDRRRHVSVASVRALPAVPTSAAAKLRLLRVAFRRRARGVDAPVRARRRSGAMAAARPVLRALRFPIPSMTIVWPRLCSQPHDCRPPRCASRVSMEGCRGMMCGLTANACCLLHAGRWGVAVSVMRSTLPVCCPVTPEGKSQDTKERLLCPISISRLQYYDIKH